MNALRHLAGHRAAAFYRVGHRSGPPIPGRAREGLGKSLASIAKTEKSLSGGPRDADKGFAAKKNAVGDRDGGTPD